MNNQSFWGMIKETELGQAFVLAFLSNERVYFAYLTSIEYVETPVLRFQCLIFLTKAPKTVLQLKYQPLPKLFILQIVPKLFHANA